MKKVIAFLALLIVLFIALAFLVNLQKDDLAGNNGDNVTETTVPANNPYKKSQLHPETIKLLDDPNYQNIIIPEDLDKALESEEKVIVYFFSPLCPYCREVTPVLTELSDELGKEIYQLNLLEFEEGWDKYNIPSIPTLVEYKNGKEVKRMETAKSRNAYKEWLLDQ